MRLRTDSPRPPSGSTTPRAGDADRRTDRPDRATLEALDQPEQLTALRATTTAMLPDRVAFSGVLAKFL
jgi:hypothetical protein